MKKYNVEVTFDGFSGVVRAIIPATSMQEARQFAKNAIEVRGFTVHAFKASDGSWKCPIGHIDCVKNCGSYGCGN